MFRALLGVSLVLLASTTLLFFGRSLTATAKHLLGDEKLRHVKRDLHQINEELFTKVARIPLERPKRRAIHTPHGTLCVYQGSSCEERKHGKKGRFAGCNEEVEDNVCMNFPTAGVVYTCAANEKVNVYSAPGCASQNTSSEDVTCVDMTIGTYFLLCCTSQNDPNGRFKPCEAVNAPGQEPVDILNAFTH